ncbi:MAG: carbonic anhydrase, partial [Senegalimassilia anaerobia]|nr:carbonic anhydrase [Senegalimassilia anaerobia]
MSHETCNLTVDKALERLRQGNARYLNANQAQGDVSPELRQSTFREGQRPYAIVLACSDSRVIPEAIFSAGIG